MVNKRLCDIVTSPHIYLKIILKHAVKGFSFPCFSHGKK